VLDNGTLPQVRLPRYLYPKRLSVSLSHLTLRYRPTSSVSLTSIESRLSWGNILRKYSGPRRDQLLGARILNRREDDDTPCPRSRFPIHPSPFLFHHRR
jgi:hypothetical protein